MPSASPAVTPATSSPPSQQPTAELWEATTAPRSARRPLSLRLSSLTAASSFSCRPPRALSLARRASSSSGLRSMSRSRTAGVVVDVFSTLGCFQVTVQETFFLQTCLQSDTACAPHPTKRNETSAELVPRQDASCFSHGDTFTILATDQDQTVSSVVSCSSPDGCSQQISFTESFSDTISIEVSAGVEGLFMATFGVSFTMESSTMTSTTFNIPDESQVRSRSHQSSNVCRVPRVLRPRHSGWKPPDVPPYEEP
ncbi:hypothetical protein GE09DRAFT_521716 [Coniochaeta sp. 2T2.1]|nr:hypothetical protein GE09DRAFT_521716 [Coniochaeta sp. 2T2.1]